MVNKKTIDWVDLESGIDIICNPEESLKDRQGASRVFLKDTERLTGTSIERIRLDLYRFTDFGDSLDSSFLRSEFNQLCAEYATIAVELQQKEYALEGKKGGRKPTYKKEEILEQYEKLKGKHPKYTMNHLSEMLAEQVGGSDRNIRRILSDILEGKLKK